LTHPSLLLADSAGYPPGGIQASQLFFLRLLWSSKFESPVRYFKFGPSLRSNGTTMPSA